MNKLHELLNVKEMAEFKYIVLDIKFSGSNIKCRQDGYVKKLKYSPMEK